MFDLITGKGEHLPSTPAIPILISTSVQGTACEGVSAAGGGGGGTTAGRSTTKAIMSGTGGSSRVATRKDASTMTGLVAPPLPVSHQPVRIGGQIEAPALIHRVEPIYPLLAQMSKIDGVVILAAIVGEDGRVRSVKVLRGHPILGKAATDTVAQWQYEPLRLDGTPAAFELTVSLWFHFDNKPKRRL